MFGRPSTDSYGDSIKLEDKYIEMDFDKMREYTLQKIKEKEENLSKQEHHTTAHPQEEDIDIDNLISTTEKKSNKYLEEETFNNVKISAKQLESMFSKDDFTNLEVIGQFNKGFIIAIMRDNGHLFIID